MYCPDCGHNNPPKNRYCGMCGHALSEMAVSDPTLVTDVAAPAEGPGPVQSEPVPVHAEPERTTRISSLGSAPVRSEYAPPRGYGFLRPERPVTDETLVTPPEQRVEPRSEESTTLGGPSFLGLSGPAGGSEESYSYLLDPEDQPSHVGRWVGALLLVVLALTVYLKWQPLKTWVVNTAMSHTAPPAAPKPVPSADQATITTGNSDVPAPTAGTTSGSPPIETSVNTPPKNALPQQDKETEAPAKASEPAAVPPDKAAGPADKTAAAPAPKAPAAKPAEPAGDEAPETAATPERPSAARRRSAAAPVPQGNELVSNGERYLYGRGVPRNCDQALTYFRAAAGRNNARAFSHLGALYATGECVPLDRAQAYSWFSRALSADRRNPYYERNLTMLWRDMSSDERQRAMARR